MTNNSKSGTYSAVKEVFYFISLYFPNGPKGDNTDWLKDIALSNKSYLIMGDFNAHAPFLGKWMYISNL